MEKIIDIKNLRVSFHTYAGEVQAVRDVSFYAKRRDTCNCGRIGLWKVGYIKSCDGADRTTTGVKLEKKVRFCITEKYS